MKRRIIAIVVGVAVVAAAGVLIGRPRWADRCSASFQELPAADLAKFRAVPVDQVKVDDFPEPQRENVRNLLAVAQHPVAPLGSARSAVVVPHRSGAGAALVNSNDGDVRFEVGGGGLIGTATSGAVVQVDGETGKAVWGRRQVGYGVGGRDLADRMMLMHTPRDKAPRVTAVNTSNGDLAWCTKLGQDSTTHWRPTFDSAASGDAMFVVRESDAGEDADDDDVRLSRLDARSGKVIWDKPVAGLPQADSLHVLHDQLLLSPFHTDQDANGRMRLLDPSDKRPQSIVDRGAVMARSAADGAATWSYRGPDGRGWVSNVLGTGKDIAVVLSRRASSQGKLVVNETWLTGIDRTGKELWKHDFKSQYDHLILGSFEVVGDLVLSHEQRDLKANKSTLVARSLADGTERWRTQLPTSGTPLRPGASEVVGNSLVANTYADGLIAVDLGSGAVSNPLPGQKIGPIDRIVSDGRTVTIDANGLFLTFNRTS